MAPPVKEYALSQNIPVYQPVKMRDGTALALVRELAPELIVVAAYGRILPEEILQAPRHGSINVHSSILPKYRGAAPINWAILNGDDVTGVTIMYMAKELDAGDVILCRETPIDPNEDAQALTVRLAELGADALHEAIERISDGTAVRTPQDCEKATYAPMLTKEMSEIDWSRSARQIHDQVRGLIPWPCAKMTLLGKTVKLFRTELGSPTSVEPEAILDWGRDGIEIACADGMSIIIKEVQPDGGKRMSAAAFLAGNPIFKNRHE